MSQPVTIIGYMPELKPTVTVWTQKVSNWGVTVVDSNGPIVGFAEKHTYLAGADIVFANLGVFLFFVMLVKWRKRR